MSPVALEILKQSGVILACIIALNVFVALILIREKNEKRSGEKAEAMRRANAPGAAKPIRDGGP